ncbi:MAG TPA: hypothetical protein VF499_11850 [Afipia sp.]
MKQHIIIAALALLTTSSAWAQEPVGCENFKWPVTRERAALAQSDASRLAIGGDLDTLPRTAVLELQPAAEAKLPTPPERAPKPNTFAGFAIVKAIPANGLYSISLSAGGWVDVVQNGVFLKPKAFSGVTGCDGIRKTVRFGLAAGPATIQISGVAEPSVRIAIMPVAE